jgi:hypothetical protein
VNLELDLFKLDGFPTFSTGFLLHFTRAEFAVVLLGSVAEPFPRDPIRTTQRSARVYLFLVAPRLVLPKSSGNRPNLAGNVRRSRARSVLTFVAHGCPPCGMFPGMNTASKLQSNARRSRNVWVSLLERWKRGWMHVSIGVELRTTSKVIDGDIRSSPSPRKTDGRARRACWNTALSVACRRASPLTTQARQDEARSAAELTIGGPNVYHTAPKTIFFF